MQGRGAMGLFLLYGKSVRDVMYPYTAFVLTTMRFLRNQTSENQGPQLPAIEHENSGIMLVEFLATERIFRGNKLAGGRALWNGLIWWFFEIFSLIFGEFGDFFPEWFQSALCLGNSQ